MEPSAPHRHGTRLYTTLGTGALAVGALAYVGLADPHRPGSLFPPCPFKLLTGLNCPACGGLRMTHDLLHGDLAAAVVDNVFLLIGLPALALWVLWRVKQGQRAFTLPGDRRHRRRRDRLDGGPQHARLPAGPHTSRAVVDRHPLIH